MKKETLPVVQRAPVSYGGGMYPGFILDFVGVCSESACEVWSFGRVRRIYVLTGLWAAGKKADRFFCRGSL